MNRMLAGLVLALMPLPGSAQLAPNAPADNPRLTDSSQYAAIEREVAPLVEQARASFAAARDRFLAGLPAGETFYITTRLKDEAGRQEQVFIRVLKIADGKIDGVIANQINLVSGYRAGQAYSFSESSLLDWTITKPDGSEEGNLIGRYIDSRRLSPAKDGQASPPVPAELVPAVELAQRRGRLLATAIRGARPVTRAQRSEARKLGADLCSFDYKHVFVDDSGQNLAYLVGTSRNAADIIAGRHYMLLEGEARPSTNGCLNLGSPAGPDGARAVVVTMTHLLSSVPNEYHVYLSLIQPVALAVITDLGMWLVQNGSIHLYSLRER